MDNAKECAFIVHALSGFIPKLFFYKIIMYNLGIVYAQLNGTETAGRGF